MTASAHEPHVGLVVEGAGDRNALPVLLRAYLEQKGEYRDVLGKPVPLHGRDRAIVPNGIEGYVATSAGRPGCVGVLIVLDGEGDCVAQLGPALSDRARKITGKPVFVALADHDYEDWIYASVETLQLGDIAYDPSKRGVTTLQKVLRPTKYVKPVWQPRLTSRIDINMAASRSPSLKRMLARFDQLTKHLP